MLPGSLILLINGSTLPSSNFFQILQGCSEVFLIALTDVIDGSLSTELSFQEENSSLFNYKFDHCIIKLDPTINTSNSYYQSTIINQAVKFEDPYQSDFHLTENSPAIDAGYNTTNNIDIEGNTRQNPDIGAYEFIP